MINRLIKGLLVFGVVLLAMPAPSAFAQAYITINSTGSNSVSISVSGAPYGQSIDLVYTLPGSSLPTVISNIGNAYSGTWSGTLNLNEYGIVNGSSVYVRVGGQQSNTIIAGGYLGGCTYNCGTPYGLSLSQNNVSLSVGQSQTVSAYGSSGSIYISSNSNPSVVSAAVNSGNQISLYGLANGSSTVSVCTNSYSYGSYQSCASIYVTVSGSVAGTSTNLYFVPSNPTMSVGQDLAVSINSTSYTSGYYYGSTAYYISSNSNPNVVSANVSGTALNLHANQSGNSTITVCHSGLSFCGSLSVSVSGGSGSGLLTFSENNVYLNYGQSRTVTVYNSTGYASSYYISSNSNPSAVSASVSGSQVYLYAQNSGSATISVCLSGNPAYCGSLYVNSGGGGSGGSITFSPQNPSVGLNQSMTVSIYGASSSNYYISSNSNPNAVTASVSGANLYLYGKNYGSSTIIVCQSGYSSCGTLFVNVGGGSYGGTLTLSQSSLNLSPYQSAAVTVYGSGSYYISSNSNPSAASASISGSSVNIYAYASGSTTVNICQNYNSQCAVLVVNVGGGYYGGNVQILSTTLPTMVLGQYYSHQLNATGGIPPYTFSIDSGALPAGLSLSSTGLLYGIPTYAYTANFSVRATDNRGQSGVTPFTVYGNTGSGYSGGGVLGTSIYKNGQLIKENGTVYIVYRNTKSGFANSGAFTGFGFKFANVVDVGNSGLPSSGYTISTSNASHPWGSWIKSGQTVYFVHETGLIPVPDWTTFLNNGGQANLIVNANLRDFQLPMLSPMVGSDSRLN